MRVFFTAVFLLFTAFPAYAGFDEGMAAYKARDFERAYKEWFPLAHDGQAAAQNNIGLMYRRGQGVAVDQGEAESWFRKAAVQGYASAQYNLGVLFQREGKDHAEAIKWLKKAAEADHAGAQNNLGVVYRRGLGTDVDYGEALKWFSKAAEQSHPRAEYNLARMYGDGMGTDLDYVKAFVWLEFAVKDLPVKGQKAARAFREKVAKRLSGKSLERAKRMAREWKAKRAEWGEAMTLIPWKAQYSVGNEELDDQHMRLFSLINMLYRAWVYGDEITVLGDIFDDMLSYTVYHFRREEELLTASKFVQLKEHQLQHKQLQDRVLAFHGRNLSGSEAAQLTTEVSEFLRSWMTVHVLDRDLQYKSIFR